MVPSTGGTGIAGRSTLLVYIDDATSELMHLKMVESASIFAYMDAPRELMPCAQQAEPPHPHLLGANHNTRWSRAARIASTFSLDHSNSAAMGNSSEWPSVVTLYSTAS